MLYHVVLFYLGKGRWIKISCIRHMLLVDITNILLQLKIYRSIGSSWKIKVLPKYSFHTFSSHEDFFKVRGQASLRVELPWTFAAALDWEERGFALQQYWKLWTHHILVLDRNWKSLPPIYWMHKRLERDCAASCYVQYDSIAG